MDKWDLVYILAVMACMAIVASEGIGLKSWKWWAIIACMVVANISGALIG
jgi:hypothetical protein